jgi:uncharacterized protein (DUF362 family)/Pyruvate/2-oxoacid:ferredoxin oxidoreductase delta subunit
MGDGKLNKMAEASECKVFVSDAEYDGSLSQVIENILTEFPLEWDGKKVLVKPNILAPHPPEKAVTTHPLLVKYVVEALVKRGAEVIVGDNPGVGGYGRSKKSADVCGFMEVVGDHFINLGQNVTQYPIKSRFMDTVAFSQDVLDVDYVINLPKLKTHGLTFITGCIKNTFGYVVGGDKMTVHAACPTPQKFAEALVDIFSIRPPDLNIMDAIVGMEGNGPSNGNPIKIGKILASDNATACDAASLHLLGLKVRDVPCLEIAGKRGLGETDISKIKIIGDLKPIPIFKTPNHFVPGLMGIVLNRFLSRWINSDPTVITDLCKSCGLCARHCPVEAMQMTKEGPKLTKDDCIHCYCCQELCPEDAIKLSGRTINLIRGTMLRE